MKVDTFAPSTTVTQELEKAENIKIDKGARTSVFSADKETRNNILEGPTTFEQGLFSKAVK